MEGLQIKPDLVPEKPILSNLLLDRKGKPITTRSGWKHQRAYLENRWKTFLGLYDLPPITAPLKTQITFVDTFRSCSRYRLQYNLENKGNFTTEAYLLVPNAILLKKMPAFVAFHQTTNEDAKEPAGLGTMTKLGMNYGVQLAELGYVVLCPRNFLDLGSPRERWKEQVQEVRKYYSQWKGITRMVYDAMRAVDVLRSFAFVDPSSIGRIGHSLGAKEVPYAAAFDHRYKVTICSEGGIGLAESNTRWDYEWYLGCTFEQINMDHHELLALIAPRPFLLLAGRTVLPGPPEENEVDDEKSWKYIKAAMPVYDLLGYPKNIGWLHHKKGHNYPEEAQAATREFVMAHLPPP